MISYTSTSPAPDLVSESSTFSSELSRVLPVDSDLSLDYKKAKSKSAEAQNAEAKFVDVEAVKRKTQWLVFAAAVVMISVPVFIQAPLVRVLPWFSLALTPGLFGLALWLVKRSAVPLWGDLLLGFSWTWLSGSIYWGWFRWEPLLHLPIEAIGLPFALVFIAKGWNKSGNWFYIGSLFGTAVTDLYFYLVDLIPHWRRLMQVAPEQARPVFQAALAQMQTPHAAGSAIALFLILLIVGSLPLRSTQLHWWAFGGAVLSTILVDGLFWLAATAA